MPPQEILLPTYTEERTQNNSLTIPLTKCVDPQVQLHVSTAIRQKRPIKKHDVSLRMSMWSNEEKMKKVHASSARWHPELPIVFAYGPCELELPPKFVVGAYEQIVLV